mgnify:CR=1 FL=1
MRITLIAAVADNLAIGQDNALAWQMPADRAFFRAQIEGHDVVMGRLTYEAHQAEEPLPYRLPIVVTRQPDYHAPDAAVVTSLTAAYDLARERGETELFVLGGGKVYAQAIEQADRLLVTEIHTEVPGDAFFPEMNPTQWHEASREPHPADADNPFAYEFVEYRRRPAIA